MSVMGKNEIAGLQIGSARGLFFTLSVEVSKAGLTTFVLSHGAGRLVNRLLLRNLSERYPEACETMVRTC